MSANTRGRTGSDSSKGSNAMQHTMSPRLPRKSRQPGAYSSTSKLDSAGSLQVQKQIILWIIDLCTQYMYM